MKAWKRLGLVCCGVLVVYIVAYVALSRRGYAEADQFRFKGFYYFHLKTPTLADAERSLRAAFLAP